MKWRMKMILAISLSVFLAGCSNSENNDFEAPFEGKISHVHGMGYPGTDEGLYFATHEGLKIYRQGNWFKTPNNYFDYMGFNAVDDGFITSGHPSADSDMPNPLGIQRSLNNGKSLEHIAFEGKSDFHTMAVGYKSHDIFLWNHAANSQLGAGLYKSIDQGESWIKLGANHLDGEIFSLALHPTDSMLVAAATLNGVYLSKDGGKNFTLISHENKAGTAVFFNEEYLYFASHGLAASLTKYAIDHNAQQSVMLPELRGDKVAYISQPPSKKEQLTIFTATGQSYIMKNDKGDWQQILKDGNTH